MKKVKVITINDLTNYGNRLQNYAVQEVLSKMDFYPENMIDETYYSETKEKFFSSKIWIKKLLYLVRFFVCESFSKKIVAWNNQITRNRNFNEFNKYIKYSGIKVTDKTLNNSPLDNEIFIVGSDQVWNPKFAMSSVTLLENVKSDNKISFSASFGVDSISFDQKIKNCLDDFKALSVREEAGARIIKSLTGRDAMVLVDPTMMLTTEEWRKISKKPKGAKEGYILTYFLSPKCDFAKKQLEKITMGREVYELLNLEDLVAGNAGPSEFLWLFDHADIILTDSFHACVFSFLFDKPFIVYDRNWDGGNMNSRLETMLSKFHLERKYASSGLQNDIWEHDYEEGYKQLEIERKKAEEFLKEALEG